MYFKQPRITYTPPIALIFPYDFAQTLPCSKALPVPGRMLAAGIPSYRLPRHILEAEIEAVRRLGVEIRCNVKVGEDISLAELQQAYAAVFLAASLHEKPEPGR